MSTFVNYRRDPLSLEGRLFATFEDLDVNTDNQSEICAFLAPLRNKGPVYRYHYDHSLRVAFLCVDVAHFMHLKEKALLYAGLLHDIGKAQVLVETLGKTSGWTEKDTRNIRPHVMDGYRLIRDKFDFSAEIILWHHKFQAKGYPAKMPRLRHKYSFGTKMMIQLYGRILSLCDQFDAFHRINDKSPVALTGEEIKSLMLKANPDQVGLLDELYKADIFTTYTEPVKLLK